MSFFNLFDKSRNSQDDITFAENLSYPIMSIVSNIKAFFVLSGLVSLCISLVTFFGGRGFFCNFFQTGSFCYYSPVMMILSCLVNFYGMAFFVNRWQRIISHKKSVTDAIKEKCFAKDMKALGVLLLYLGLWGVIAWCAVMLRQRVATKDVVWELGYFILFSGIIIFCLFLLLNFVGFYHYLQGGKFFTLHETIGRSWDNLYTLVTVFFVYMLIFVFLAFRGEGLVSAYLEYSVVIEYLGDFYFYFIICAILAVFVGSFEYQEKKLFGVK